MPYRGQPYSSPGYGRILPILLGFASVVCFVSCVPLLDRTSGCTPTDPAVHGEVVGYVEDNSRAEGQVLLVRLFSHNSHYATVTVRDDRPWRTFMPEERVRLLFRSGLDRRGHPTLEYIIDDFAARWGGLIARAGAAVLCDVAAVVALLVTRRRPSAARHFPPPIPRRPPSAVA